VRFVLAYFDCSQVPYIHRAVQEVTVWHSNSHVFALL
jgi:hypothetical protein